MHSAAAIRLQVESALANRVPAALTPAQQQIRAIQPTGIPDVDDIIGGFPVGAITELTGSESSGRTSLGLAFLARVTQQGGVCAWIDASDTLSGESAAAAGLDLSRLLWVRCGVHAGHKRTEYSFAVPGEYYAPQVPRKGLHGGGFGPHPRTETKGMSEAMGELFRRESIPVKAVPEMANRFDFPAQPKAPASRNAASDKPWGRIEQALKATDLILQAGGFGAVVLDLGSMAPEYVSRVELSVWFRYRAAVEKSQASLVLLTRYPCAKSAGELFLRLHPGESRADAGTVFTGVTHRLEVERRRFTDNIFAIKKPPQRTHSAWQTHPAWGIAQ